MNINIKNLSLEDLEPLFIRAGIAKFHAKQVLRWVYQKGVFDFELISDLSKANREFLKNNFYLSKPELAKKEVSKDKTIKLLLKLKDDNFIETVVIPSKERATICLSSQVGCKFNCAFCMSGSFGFTRNLEVAEIIDQFLLAQSNFKEKITHIVFMGIGEPLDNYDNVLRALKIFNNSEYGRGIGARRITISTCGLIPAIQRLADENLQFELSVSLHSAIDVIRDKLVPINKTFNLRSLGAALKEYYKKTKRQITFEYVMLKGVNIDEKSTEALVKFMRGYDCKLNLIPFNCQTNKNFMPPLNYEIEQFKSMLEGKGIRVTVRVPRGSDISAACGQLKARSQI